MERWYTSFKVCVPVYMCEFILSLGHKWSDPPLVKEQNNKSGKYFLHHIDESTALWQNNLYQTSQIFP